MITSPTYFFGNILGMFTAFLLDFVNFPPVMVICATCAVLGCIRLAFYLFDS